VTAGDTEGLKKKKKENVESEGAVTSPPQNWESGFSRFQEQHQRFPSRRRSSRNGRGTEPTGSLAFGGGGNVPH